MLKKANLQSQTQIASEGSLKGKVALLFDGTHAGGRSLALSLAKQGVDIALVFRQAHVSHAQEIKRLVEAKGQRCLIIPAQTDKEIFSQEKVQQTLKALGRLDIFIDYSSPLEDDVESATSLEITEKRGNRIKTGLFTHVDAIVSALDRISSMDHTDEQGREKKAAKKE